MGEYVVRHAYQRIFLAVHGAVLADEGEAVNIGVYYDAEVVATLLQFAHDAGEVFLQWLGVVGEVAVGFAVEYGVLHAEAVEEGREDDAAYAVDGIDNDLELCLPHCLRVHEFQCHHGVDVSLVEALLGVFAEVVHVGEGEALCLCYGEHLRSVCRCEEFSIGVEQLQGVPVARVVRRGDDDAAVSACHCHGEFGGGR